MTVIAQDPDGKRDRDFDGPLPDALVGPNNSWFVSQRVYDLVMHRAENAVRFQKVNLEFAPGRQCAGNWYLMVFQQFADVILEDRSNLLWVYNSHVTWDKDPSEGAPQLYAYRQSVEGLQFWSGAMHHRAPPCNAASVGFTYCSDDIMDGIVAEKITGFGPCYKVNLIESNDTGTIAPRAPAIAKDVSVETGDSWHVLTMTAQHFGGVVRNPDRTGTSDTPVEIRVPTNETLPDVWEMERLLIVSARARAVFEAHAARDCTFVDINCVADEAGQTSVAPNTYSILTAKILRPYALEQSSGMRVGLHSNGTMTLTMNSGGMVVNASMTGDCVFWNETLPNTGHPRYICAGPLMQALKAAEITGFESHHAYQGIAYQ
ncbi:hypothetical protein ACJ5NV_09785 [Loktanella agnita]|uniref:hypothetical protein n=1 Tax=Loktanella agnita TaxID=287097 RepID=UPI003985F2D7